MEDLAAKWAIDDPWQYLAWVIVGSISIRAFHSVLRALKIAHDMNRWRAFLAAVWWSFRGFQPKDSPVASEYGYAFILGSLELAAYPILMAANAWTAIGAWIGLKTISQWKAWTDDRSTFNLFLIGNVVVLMVALALEPMVRITD